jgi:hypothetical protein
MPVPHRAAEAYVLFALLAKLPAKSLERLAGWTQTSVNPSPLARLLAQESRRNVLGKCFTCGAGDHFAYDCKALPEAAPYPCKCGATLRITSRGQTPTETRSARAEPPTGEKRDAPSRAEEAEPKRRRVSLRSSCLRVRICGAAYTTLSRYLNDSNPNRHQRKKVLDKCMAKAVEVAGGDSKTLSSQGFAKQPRGLGRELRPGRSNLPHDWVESACTSVRSLRSHGKSGSKFVELRKAITGGEEGKCKGILWRLEDLEKVLGSD